MVKAALSHPLSSRIILLSPDHYFLTIHATAPLSLPIICDIHFFVLSAWWRRNSTSASECDCCTILPLNSGQIIQQRIVMHLLPQNPFCQALHSPSAASHCIPGSRILCPGLRPSFSQWAVPSEKLL